jgi:hypothetical protein
VQVHPVRSSPTWASWGADPGQGQGGYGREQHGQQRSGSPWPALDMAVLPIFGYLRWGERDTQLAQLYIRPAWPAVSETCQPLADPLTRGGARPGFDLRPLLSAPCTGQRPRTRLLSSARTQPIYSAQAMTCRFIPAHKRDNCRVLSLPTSSRYDTCALIHEYSIGRSGNETQRCR